MFMLLPVTDNPPVLEWKCIALPSFSFQHRSQMLTISIQRHSTTINKLSKNMEIFNQVIIFGMNYALRKRMNMIGAKFWISRLIFHHHLSYENFLVTFLLETKTSTPVKLFEGQEEKHVFIKLETRSTLCNRLLTFCQLNNSPLKHVRFLEKLELLFF